MKQEINRTFSPRERVWTGNLTRPRKRGTFKELSVGYDKFNRLQASFRRTDGENETYNPRLTPIEIEHQVITSSTDPDEGIVPSYDPRSWPISFLHTTHISQQ